MAKKNVSDKSNAKIAKGLSHFLADTFVLYVKSFNFHWNMVGSNFFMFHKLIEDQYKEMAESIDELAERIRQIGHVAPGSMAEFLELTSFKESKGNLSWEEMVQELVNLHEAMDEQGKALIAITDESGDPGTSDLLIERIRFHAKQAWLLRSHLE